MHCCFQTRETWILGVADVSERWLAPANTNSKWAMCLKIWKQRKRWDPPHLLLSTAKIMKKWHHKRVNQQHCSRARVSGTPVSSDVKSKVCTLPIYYLSHASVHPGALCMIVSMCIAERALHVQLLIRPLRSLIVTACVLPDNPVCMCEMPNYSVAWCPAMSLHTM